MEDWPAQRPDRGRLTALKRLKKWDSRQSERRQERRIQARASRAAGWMRTDVHAVLGGDRHRCMVQAHTQCIVI